MLNQFKQRIAKHLFLKFKKQEAKIHELKYLFWECTTRCNLHCLHCGSDCKKDSKQKDMPMADFLSAIDTIKADFKPISVVFTGGEPLLRNDLEECGKELRNRGFRWGLVTNGLLYTNTRHNSLLNAGIGALTISLDGLKENHNWLRNSEKIFDNVDKAIELVTGTPRINFDIVTCVNQKNINELPLLYNYLIAKNVKAWRLFTIAPIGRAIEHAELFLKPDQLKQLMNFIVEKRKEKNMDVKFSCEGYVGAYETKVRDGYFFCRAGINIASVLIDGSISACPNIDRSFSQGNIYKDNFSEVWEIQFETMRNRVWTKTGKCKNCRDFNSCQGNGLHYWNNKKKEVLFCHKNHMEILNTDQTFN